MANSFPRSAYNSSGAPDNNTHIITDNSALVIIKSNGAYCWNCDRLLGNIDRRNLISGEMVLTNRTKFRCRCCSEKNVWEPRIK